MVHKTIHNPAHKGTIIMIGSYVVKVGKSYRYRRRVPKEVAHLDPRKEIKIALKTKDPKIAHIRADIYNEQIEQFWSSLIHKQGSGNFDTEYKAAVQLAKAYGFAYKTAKQIAKADITEITQRLAKVNTPILTFESSEQENVTALLGGIDPPKVELPQCWELFEDLVHDRTVSMSKDQKRKWKNVRKAAITNFNTVTNVVYLHAITRSDILLFWEWWNKQIAKGKSANTANKQLSCLRDVLRTVASKHDINLDIAALFAETSFKEIVKSRPPFEAGFVQKVLLPATNTLKDRDKYGFWAIADTGMRQSELFGLLPVDIFLEEAIPYVWIRPRKDYRLKTRTSERKIPLVGVALAAFRKFPKGFSHLGNAECFSAAINDFLTSKNLRPSPEHSAYSLRHTFKDRLRDYGESGAPEEIIDELMGHRKPGVQYGRGHKLETKHTILSRIAYSEESCL